jgi:hypothetical protein
MNQMMVYWGQQPDITVIEWYCEKQRQQTPK